jgi:hypothetical protein
MALLLAFETSSCIKSEDNGPACKFQNNEKCLHVAPSKQPCTNYLERWFYDVSTKTCEKIRFSACEVKGFASQIECDSCKCRK